MNVLIVSLHLPYPPLSGAQIRRWQMLSFLAQRHRVTLISFSGAEERIAPEPLREICEQVVIIPHPSALSDEDLEVGRGAPGPLKWFGVAAMARAIKAVEPYLFDLVIVDTLYMTMYRDLLPPQTVLVEHNIESQIHKQYAQLKYAEMSQSERTLWGGTWRMMEAYENRVWQKFSLRATVSDEDRREMDRRCPAGRTIVVENGVDLKKYSLLPVQGKHAILFTGALDYFPNVDASFYFVREILPHIWHTAPEVQVWIAGSHPPTELVDLADPPRLHVVASPAEMEPIAAQTSIAVVPLRIGGGTRLKILEALAWGLPVVTTSVGCEALAVTDGRDVLIRDTPQDFAGGVVQLLFDKALVAVLRSNGRALVEIRYGWQPIFERLGAELESFVQAQHGVLA